ncbi:hypothetical protein ACP70R_033626 [Stipagrostis hirtigluma subsp. patula]
MESVFLVSYSYTGALLDRPPPPTGHDEAERRGAHAAGDDGLAMATAAEREGARRGVSILARNAVRLEAARAAVRGSTQQDVRDAAALARALQEAVPVDVLVCNLAFVPQPQLRKV